MTMDYSPWSEREIWPFLRAVVSPKPERPHPPKSVYMHVTSIHTCMNSLSRYLIIFESFSISETGEVTPTKIGVCAFDINPYMHEFFEPILID